MTLTEEDKKEVEQMFNYCIEKKKTKEIISEMKKRNTEFLYLLKIAPIIALLTGSAFLLGFLMGGILL